MSEEFFGFESLVDQAELQEPCPCGSPKSFGACCGSEFDCDCNSKLMAADCCYIDDGDEAVEA